MGCCCPFNNVLFLSVPVRCGTHEFIYSGDVTLVIKPVENIANVVKQDGKEKTVQLCSTIAVRLPAKEVSYIIQDVLDMPNAVIRQLPIYALYFGKNVFHEAITCTGVCSELALSLSFAPFFDQGLLHYTFDMQELRHFRPHPAMDTDAPDLTTAARIRFM